jgi:hypothetical protein
LVAFCVSPAWAQQTNVLIDFNTPGLFTGNFTALHGANNCVENTTIGVGGSGGVQVTGNNDTTHIFNLPVGDFSAPGATFHLSLLLKANAQTSGNRLQLGLASNLVSFNTDFGKSWETFRFMPTSATNWSLRVQTRSANNMVETILQNSLIVVSGRWYKFSINLTNVSTSAGQGNLEMDCSLHDYGLDGLTPGTNLITVNTMQQFTNHDTAKSTNVYAGFRCFNNAGIDAWDDFAVNWPPPAALPGAPTGLSAVAQSFTPAGQSILLTWTDTEPVVSQFKIEQSTNNVDFVQIAVVPAAQHSYTDSGLLANTNYYYKVRASNATGDSAPATASATTAAFAVNVNFGRGNLGDVANTPSPAVPGYANDIGEVYGLRTNGFTYGWDADNQVNARWCQQQGNPGLFPGGVYDLRYDTLIHLQKQTPARVWGLAVPSGVYQVHVASGDPSNTEMCGQFYIEGLVTPGVQSSGAAHFADFTNLVFVNDGRLTITAGPSSTNSKVCFVDIATVLTPPALTISMPPQPLLLQSNGAATFAVTPAGVGQYFYQWYFGATLLPDQTNASLVLSNVTLGLGGNYHVVVTNAIGQTAISSDALLTVNRSPVPGADGFSTVSNQVLLIAGVKMLANDFDPDGDPLTILSVTSPTSQGGSVSCDGTQVTYSPFADFVGTDTFAYTLSDGRGGTATGTVTVIVQAGGNAGENQISIEVVGGQPQLRFAGIPGFIYRIQRTDALQGVATIWTEVGTATADAQGRVVFTEDNPPAGNAFYRTIWP